VFHARTCLPVSVSRALSSPQFWSRFCDARGTHRNRVHRNDSNSPVGVVRDDACARGECIPGIFQFTSFGVLGPQNSDIQTCWPAYDRWGVELSLRSPDDLVEMHHSLVRTCTWYRGVPCRSFDANLSVFGLKTGGIQNLVGIIFGSPKKVSAAYPAQIRTHTFGSTAHAASWHAGTSILFRSLWTYATILTFRNISIYFRPGVPEL